MAEYKEKEQELIFSPEESEAERCPVCAANLDYGCSETHDNLIVYPWSCGKCGAEGKEYGKISFDGHNVDFTTIPVDMQLVYTGAQTLCINGPLKVGDLVLSTVDDGALPCLPGRVTAIDMLGSKDHGTDNETDDVHVDFTGDYGERRKREIVEVYADLYGYERPYEEVGEDDLIMDPASLINITGIEDEKLRWIMESEQNAISYAYQVVRALI